MLWMTPDSVIGDSLPSKKLLTVIEKSANASLGRAEAAHRTHLLRSSQTETVIKSAIANLIGEGKKLSLTAVAEKTSISREHLSRRYRRLIDSHKL